MRHGAGVVVAGTGMEAATHDTSEEDLTLIYLCPLVWQPLKVNFARRFELLSEKCSGYIFTMSGIRQRGTTIKKFRVYTEPDDGSRSRHCRRVWLQAILPLFLLWKRRRRRNVVVAYDAYGSGLAGVLLKCVLRAKLIIEINGDDQNQWTAEHGSIKRIFMGLLFRLSVTLADAVKVVNSHQEAFVKKHFPRKQIYRYPDFMASEYFASLDSMQGDYLLSIGYPFHLKGMDVLIRAFQDVSHKYPSCRLKIMGFSDAAELTRFKALAKEDFRVEFLKPGWIEDVAELVRGCYAFVSASRREAAARVIFEAMACRKPIISSRTNSGNDYVRHGETGFLFDVGDSKDLATKLDLLLENPERARKMGEEGFQWLEREFCEGVYIDKFILMIREVSA
jgi:glycosyltransferase involved in cell wall biosynthesis